MWKIYEVFLLFYRNWENWEEYTLLFIYSWERAFVLEGREGTDVPDMPEDWERPYVIEKPYILNIDIEVGNRGIKREKAGGDF